jgi:hypothetical protein
MNTEKILKAMSHLPLREVGAKLKLTKQRVSQLYKENKINRHGLKAEEIKKLLKPVMLTNELREIANKTHSTYPYTFLLAQRNGTRIRTALDVAFEKGEVECLKCGKVKALADYYDSKCEPRGKSRVCKECAIAVAKLYYRQRK